ncbi:hypothetical protein ACXX89_01815, partial [Mycoplasma sp. 1012]
MKKNLKNVLLTLGTSTTALAGFAFVVSCGKTEAKKPETSTTTPAPSNPSTTPEQPGNGGTTTTTPDSGSQTGSGGTASQPSSSTPDSGSQTGSGGTASQP